MISNDSFSPAISCQDLRINYSGNQVLDGFSMDVVPGRVHALLGRNGAGKSTCFRMILGLEYRGEGKVEVLGRTRSRESLKDIGASINGPALYRHLSATDNLRIHAKLLGLDRSEVDRVLAAVGLSMAGRKKTRDFSTGMKARLAIAIAMLGNPKILILDEPQNGLDPQGIADLRGFIRGWARQGGTVLISSHQLGEVAKLTDDITVLASGKTLYTGTLKDFAPAGQLEEKFLAMTQGGVSVAAH
ncbi:ATP-binding cassette domain-containing protein [Corynebacterium sp. ZY180755]